MSSPRGEAFASPTGAAIHRNAANLQSPLPHTEWAKREWWINNTVPKTFSGFNGQIAEYINWYDRVRDHLSLSIVATGRVLDLAQYPITLPRLCSIKLVDKAPGDLEVVPSQLWSFVGHYGLGDKVYSRRVQAVNGEVSNGLEHRKRLYTENDGRGGQAVMAGLRGLHDFPQCPEKTKRGAWPGEWPTLVRAHRHSHSQQSLFIMRTSMLPEGVAREVQDRKSTPHNTDNSIGYLNGELARYSAKPLRAVQGKQELNRLEAAPRNAANSPMDMEKKINDMRAKARDSFASIAAFQECQSSPAGGGGRDKDRRSTLHHPNASFVVWWHRGKMYTGGRRQCPEFRALIKPMVGSSHQTGKARMSAREKSTQTGEHNLCTGRPCVPQCC